MGGLTISNKILDRYFSFLKRLDNDTKKKLIDRLANSIDTKQKKPFDLNKFHGAWDDKRTSDEIISEIKLSRVESKNDISF